LKTIQSPLANEFSNCKLKDSVSAQQAIHLPLNNYSGGALRQPGFWVGFLSMFFFCIIVINKAITMHLNLFIE
jgi:hypothetical protein